MTKKTYIYVYFARGLHVAEGKNCNDQETQLLVGILLIIIYAITNLHKNVLL